MSEPIDPLSLKMETQRLAVIAADAMEEVLKHAGISRAELARRLGVSKARVTKVLDGETNATLRTLAAFGLGCGVRWEFCGTDARSGLLVYERERPDAHRVARKYADSDGGDTLAGREQVEPSPNYALAA